MLDVLSSALNPAGPIAKAIAELYWVMIAVFGLVFVVVMALLMTGLSARRRSSDPNPPMGDNAFIVIGGIVVPAIILVLLLVYTLIVQKPIKTPENALTIEVTGHMWWWEVRYPDSDVVTANEIYIPAGEAVRLVLRSRDVIHSLWIPSLAGKKDLLPGITNTQWIKADKAGTHRGQCAEYCGLQHARMSIFVVALEKDKFQAWLTSKQQTPALPNEPHLQRGHEAFMKTGCAQCHAIRGTQAQAQIGPDLTHIGSRLTLGAGTVPNNHGNLAGWVANPQAIKPGNKMPASYIEPEAFQALIDYLASLK